MFLGDVQEYFVHVASLQSTSFEVNKVFVLVHKFFYLVFWYGTLMFQISFITQHKDWHILRVFWHWFLEELWFPRIYVLEGLSVCYVEHEDASFSASVKGSTKWLIPLLPSCIPNLQSNTLSFTIGLINDVNPLWMEVSTNGWLIYLWDCLSNIVLDQTGLAYCTVTKHHYLEYVIFLTHWLLSFHYPCT